MKKNSQPSPSATQSEAGGAPRSSVPMDPITREVVIEMRATLRQAVRRDIAVLERTFRGKAEAKA